MAPCPHCGAIQIPDRTPNEPVERQDQAPSSTQIRQAWVMSLGISLFVLIAVGVGLSRRSNHTFSKGSVPGGRSSGIKPEVLRTKKTYLYEKLETAPPSTPLNAFEPVANLPWALTIARAWAPDAVVNSVYATRLRTDGTLNLQDGGESDVRYFFSSEQCTQAARSQAEMGGPEWPTLFILHVKQGGTIAQLHCGSDFQPARPSDAPSVPDSLPLPQLVGAGIASGKLPVLPFYKIHLLKMKTEWTWDIESMTGKGVCLRASDGKVMY